MKTLLAFAGPQDPYARGLIGDEPQLGPILATILARKMGRVVIFHADETEQNARGTSDAVCRRSPGTRTQLVRLPGVDISDFGSLLECLRAACRETVGKAPSDEYFIAASAEPSTVHASWVLLTSTGELDAHLLQVRPPRYPTDTTACVRETVVPPLPRAAHELWHLGISESVGEMPPSEPSMDLPRFAAGRLPERDQEMEPSPGRMPTGRRPPRVKDLDKAMAEVGLVAEAPAMRSELEKAAILAANSVCVLILGETGTGKELVARLIHRMSQRSGKSMVAVNCGGLSTTLVESTLFGHTKGAFTGATSDQKGKFREADGGTLFFDEIGNMPLDVQPKLLRVLEDGIVEPLGSDRTVHVDVRLVVATNANFEKMISKGQFRQDLYYRLAGGVLRLPPLRERRQDIPRIALHVLDQLNRSVAQPRRLSPGAIERLQACPWPGNIRELQNAISRSMILCRHEVLEADDLLIDPPPPGPDPLTCLPEPRPGFNMEDFLRSARKQFMLRAMEIAAGNQSAAARLLGISPQAVHKFFRPPPSDG